MRVLFLFVLHFPPPFFYSQCFEATSNIPTMSFDFINIADLEKAVKDTVVGE